jgi:hypothetical protein
MYVQRRWVNMSGKKGSSKPVVAAQPGLGWVSWWLIISGIICTIDASFVLFRPRSLPGGDLASYFGPCE